MKSVVRKDKGTMFLKTLRHVKNIASDLTIQVTDIIDSNYSYRTCMKGELTGISACSNVASNAWGS